MALLASRPDAADMVSCARDAARKRRADVAALEPQQRAVRHAAIMADYAALRAASRTALQDFQARVDRRRQEAFDTAARARASARAYRAAVIAARAQGEPRTAHVRRVILILVGETTPRRARACVLPRQLLLRTAGRLVLLVYSRGGGCASPPRTAAD